MSGGCRCIICYSRGLRSAAGRRLTKIRPRDMIYINIYILSCESGVLLGIFCACRKRFRPSRGVGLLQRRIHYNNINIIIMCWCCSENRRRASRARCAAPAILFSLIKPSSGATMIFHILRPLRQYLSLSIYIYIYTARRVLKTGMYMCSVHAKRDCAEGAAICVGRSVGLAGEYISRPGLTAWVPVVVAVVLS